MFRLTLLLGLALAMAPTVVEAQGVSVAAKIGSAGVGGDLILSLAPKLALKGGIGFLPIDTDLDLGSQSYLVEPPPMLATGAVDIRLLGPFRIMAGLLYRSDDTRFGGDLTGAVEIGDGVFNAPGRLEGRLISEPTAPFLGFGLGALGSRGFHMYADFALAFTGDPTVELTGSGAITGEPGFDVELEKERVSIQGDIEDYYRFWPVLNLGFRIGF